MSDQLRPAAPDDAPDDDDLSVSALEPEGGATQRHRLPARARRPLRRLWRASGVVALIALVAIVFVAVAPHLPRLAPPPAAQTYTTLQASSNVAQCLGDASWSPDGQRIAAVESTNCDSPDFGQQDQQARLLIFDATTGRQVAVYALDTAVNAATAQIGAASNGSDYGISFYETDWSPDGHFLAAVFEVYGKQGVATGLAFLTLTGARRGHIRVTLDALNAAIPMPANGFDPVPVQRWDVTSGAHTTIYLAPALAYHWLPSDVLVADEPLPASASAPAPVEAPTPTGDPIGGPTFSLWRVGYLSLVNAQSCDSAGGPQPVSGANADLILVSPAWSPDGRYLLDASVQARLPVSGASADTFNPCHGSPAPDQLPSAPLHDKGLRSALTLLDPQGNNPLMLAWSGDGRRLAVETFTFIPEQQNVSSVTLYDCATGAALHRFSIDQFEPEPGAAIGLVEHPVWSPDGSQLLLTIGFPVAKLVILGPQSLGA